MEIKYFIEERGVMLVADEEVKEELLLKAVIVKDE